MKINNQTDIQVEVIVTFQFGGERVKNNCSLSHKMQTHKIKETSYTFFRIQGKISFRPNSLLKLKIEPAKIIAAGFNFTVNCKINKCIKCMLNAKMKIDYICCHFLKISKVLNSLNS